MHKNWEETILVGWKANDRVVKSVCSAMIGSNLQRCQCFHLFLLSILATICFYLVVMSKNRAFDYPETEFSQKVQKKNIFVAFLYCYRKHCICTLSPKLWQTHTEDPQMLRWVEVIKQKDIHGGLSPSACYPVSLFLVVKRTILGQMDSVFIDMFLWFCHSFLPFFSLWPAKCCQCFCGSTEGSGDDALTCQRNMRHLQYNTNLKEMSLCGFYVCFGFIATVPSSVAQTVLEPMMILWS